jgi:hypothetical protein
MASFDALFANEYLAAYEKFRVNQSPSRVWRFAFDRSRSGGLLILQNLLLSINAHINLDLGVVTGKAFRGRPSRISATISIASTTTSAPSYLGHATRLNSDARSSRPVAPVRRRVINHRQNRFVPAYCCVYLSGSEGMVLRDYAQRLRRSCHRSSASRSCAASRSTPRP